MVLSVIHKGTKHKMALKIAPVTQGNSPGSETLKIEMGILQKLEHENIIKIYNSVETQVL
jgi:serine/threonine protein kinase